MSIYTAYLEGSLRLDAHGEWWHNGVRFQNPKVIDLFHRSIVWDASKERYVVRLGAQQATFTMADVPFFVASLLTSEHPWRVSFLDGREEPLRPDSVSMSEGGHFYCVRHDGSKARFTRTAHQVLLQYAVDEHTLLLDGCKVRV